MRVVLILLILFLFAFSAFAGEVDVLEVKVEKDAADLYSFAVTLRHQDEGWDHYADRWEILNTSGEILATRTLYHPHVNEQPFTRSLTQVKLSSNIDTVLVRGHDSVHGYAGQIRRLKLP